MKMTRYTENQIIKSLKEVEDAAFGGEGDVLKILDLKRLLLQLEVVYDCE